MQFTEMSNENYIVCLQIKKITSNLYVDASCHRETLSDLQDVL